MPDIIVRLTEREQSLLLANELNVHESWSDIADKIRAAQRGEPVEPEGAAPLQDTLLNGTISCHECGTLVLNINEDAHYAWHRRNRNDAD